jgi:hypothetical protein
MKKYGSFQESSVLEKSFMGPSRRRSGRSQEIAVAFGSNHQVGTLRAAKDRLGPGITEGSAIGNDLIRFRIEDKA